CPVARKMLEPTAALRIVRVLLHFVIKVDGPAQGFLVIARAVIFDQRVNDERFSVKNLPVVEHLAGEIRGPKIAPVLFVEKVIEEEPIAVLRCLEIVALLGAKALEMNPRKGPDEPA